jgi:hypothetical protein
MSAITIVLFVVVVVFVVNAYILINRKLARAENIALSSIRYSEQLATKLRDHIDLEHAGDGR